MFIRRNRQRTFEILNEQNTNEFIAYLKSAFADNKNKLVAENIGEDNVRLRVNDVFYQLTKSIVWALDKGKVVGQLKYHFNVIVQDGAKMACADWIHVLKRTD